MKYSEAHLRGCTPYNAYTVLSLPSDATSIEIRKAYYKGSLRTHPDKTGNPATAPQFRAIKEAFDTLNDATTRRRHDAALRASCGQWMPGFGRSNKKPEQPHKKPQQAYREEDTPTDPHEEERRRRWEELLRKERKEQERAAEERRAESERQADRERQAERRRRDHPDYDINEHVRQQQEESKVKQENSRRQQRFEDQERRRKKEERAKAVRAEQERERRRQESMWKSEGPPKPEQFGTQQKPWENVPTGQQRAPRCPAKPMDDEAWKRAQTAWQKHTDQESRREEAQRQPEPKRPEQQRWRNPAPPRRPCVPRASNRQQPCRGDGADLAEVLSGWNLS